MEKSHEHGWFRGTLFQETTIQLWFNPFRKWLWWVLSELVNRWTGAIFWAPHGTRRTRMMNEKVRMRMVMIEDDVWSRGKGDGGGGIGGRRGGREGWGRVDEGESSVECRMGQSLGGSQSFGKLTNKTGGFLKKGYPQIIHFHGIFQCKPSTSGYPHCI